MLTERLNHLKIRSKLALFLAIPILTTLYFSISGIYHEYQQQQHTSRSIDFISVSLNLAALIHELQKERGLSAGFVGSEGRLYGNELSEQRKQTDKVLKQVKQYLQTKDPEQAFWEHPELLIRLQLQLKQLPQMRSEIDSLELDNYFEDYTKLNAIGLNITKHLLAFINNIDLAKHADALLTLLWLQERSAQGRGLLNGVFASGQLTVEQFKAISAYLTEQESLLSTFYAIATPEHQSMLRERIGHPVVINVELFQTAVMHKAAKNELLNSLQILIGYGGLIHNFKNYVIRGQQKYLEQFNNLLTRATNIITSYRNLPGVSPQEIAALNTIEETFEEYHAFLQTTKQLRAKGHTISEIDAVVKVNDTPALKAIDYLHTSLTGLDTTTWWEVATARIELIKEVSDSVRGDMLVLSQEIRESTTHALYLFLAVSLLSLTLSMVLGYLLIRRLVGGILVIAKKMDNMQKHKRWDQQIEISGNDEISDVARAFNELICEREKSIAELSLAATVFNKTYEAIMVTDADNRIEMVNPAFTIVTGYSANEIIGKTPSILNSGLEDASFYKEMWTSLQKHDHWMGEVQNRRKNGDIYHEWLNITAIKNEDGEVTKYIGMFLDVSERKQAEEKQALLKSQLVQTQKMEALGQLTGGIAHDFNNMLSAILGYTDLAMIIASGENNDKLQRYLNEIAQAGNRAKDVVSQLLAFTRTGKDAEFQHVDMGSLVSESIKMIRPLMPSTIEFTTHIAPGEITIRANPVMMHQVVMNLCINARDAITEYGHIEFAMQVTSINNEVCSSCHKQIEGEFAELTITDSGTGIDPEILDMLFEPFFTTKEMGSEKGTGMGLAMVHGIMHNHSGHIIIESTIGKGTTFRLLFPLLQVNGAIISDK